MTDYGAEIASIMKGSIDKVMLNQGDPAEIFKAANEEINSLFQAPAVRPHPAGRHPVQRLARN